MLYEYLREQMLQNPRQTLSDDSRSITYKKALEFVESFSKNLTENKYGILCSTKLNDALAILSCIVANVTAVPLFKGYGEAHTNKIVQNVQISHLITDETGVLSIKKIRDKIQEPEDLSDVAFIISTSGTTGMSKGAMITHENLISTMRDRAFHLGISEHDTMLISTPMCHSATLIGRFLIPLCNGTKIVFYNDEFSPAKLIHSMIESKATVFGGTPTSIYYLCRLIKKQQKVLPIRTLYVGGECMLKSVAKQLRETFENSEIYHIYGLTEAGPRVSLLPPNLFEQFPQSIGSPFKNLEVKCERDELLVRGVSVMKGYYNAPEYTKKAIINGWLHTGDAAKIDELGKITIKGRMDEMIIRAGINIYPQEIENALKRDPRIIDVLASGKRDTSVTQKLHIQVVADKLSQKDLMSICTKVLRPYEIPDTVELVNKLPHSESGKLIRPKMWDDNNVQSKKSGVKRV